MRRNHSGYDHNIFEAYQIIKINKFFVNNLALKNCIMYKIYTLKLIIYLQGIHKKIELCTRNVLF